MSREEFEMLLAANAAVIEQIHDCAWQLHESVNQHYGDGLPYGHHLNMVVDGVMRYGHEVIADPADLLPVVFGAFFHDSIEDARLTYHDVLDVARRFMDDKQALMAAEIVYAVTNDKGRTRAERAGERYYAGIRQTPYAPFVKLCDRIANTRFSVEKNDGVAVDAMAQVYCREYPHFISSITVNSRDIRFTLPREAVDFLNSISGV